MAVLALGLAITAIATPATARQLAHNREQTFDSSAGDARAAVERRVASYGEVLHGLRSLFAANRPVGRDAFHRYVSVSEIFNRSPGAEALTFDRLVPVGERAAFEASVQNDVSVNGVGYPDFSIHPDSPGRDMFVVEYVEPPSGNEAALGFDVGSDPVRRAAVEAARDSGETVATGPVPLIQAGGERGFLLFLAVYDRDLVPVTAPARRRAFLGVVAAAFRLDTMLNGVLGPNPGLDLEIYDVGLTTDSQDTGLEDGSLLFSSDGREVANDLGSLGGLHQLLDLNVADRRWRILARAGPGFFVAGPERVLPWGVGVGGVAFSLVLCGLVYSLARSRRVAVALAEDMTADLRMREDELRQANMELEEANAVQGLAAEAARVVSAAVDLPAAVEAFGAVVHGAVDLDRLSVALHEGDGEFRILGAWGAAGGRLPPGQRISIQNDGHWNAYRSGRPVLVDDTGADGAAPIDKELHDRGIRSYVSVPLAGVGEVRALLNFSSTRPHTFGPSDIRLFQAMVRDTAGAFNTLVVLDRERESGNRLRELDVLKNDFVAMVAHDLRSPMTVIFGFANLLQDNWSELGDTERNNFLSRITTNISRLSDLVGDVLEVARIESGEYEYEALSFDLGALAGRTVDELHTTAPERSFDLSLPDVLPNAIGDETRTWRVLTNLISNAIKFSPGTTPISVAVTATAAELQVAVRDHGPGIAAADVTKLFQRFSRLPHAGDGERPAGTGLGLYICKSLIEGQRGRLWVDSTPGYGSTFLFTLPAAEAPT